MVLPSGSVPSMEPYHHALCGLGDERRDSPGELWLIYADIGAIEASEEREGVGTILFLEPTAMSKFDGKVKVSSSLAKPGEVGDFSFPFFEPGRELEEEIP